MADLPLLPSPPRSRELEPLLLELAERRMLSPARQAGYELRLVGATVLPRRQVITRTKYGTWLFVDHVNDPTARNSRLPIPGKKKSGKIPVPADQLARLRELDRVGVRPEHLWIGHQLPANYQDGDPIPQLAPPPRHLRERDQRMALHLGRATEVFAQAALGVLAVAASPLLLGLDPVIFGGVQHPEAPVVIWAALAQWDWE